MIRNPFFSCLCFFLLSNATIVLRFFILGFQNRMVESVSLFGAICRERTFKNASVILFLNKTDVLKEKLPHSRVSDYFPSYAGTFRFQI